jgi:hypothetical protein
VANVRSLVSLLICALTNDISMLLTIQPVVMSVFKVPSDLRCRR